MAKTALFVLGRTNIYTNIFCVQEYYSFIIVWLLYQNERLLLGKKLKEMRVDELPDYFEYISIKGDELVVAGWRTKSLLLFKITY